MKILPLSHEALAKALVLTAGHPEYFTDEEGNLNIYDAILAAIWEKMKIPLATSDSKLIEYGKTHKLDYILLRKAHK